MRKHDILLSIVLSAAVFALVLSLCLFPPRIVSAEDGTPGTEESGAGESGSGEPGTEESTEEATTEEPTEETKKETEPVKKKIITGLRIVKTKSGTKNYYYYNAKGKKVRNKLMQVKVGKKKYTYYFGSTGKAVKSAWKTIAKKKYYFKISGRAAEGSYLYKGTYYVFNSKGVLCTPKKRRFYTYDGSDYLVDPDGTAVKGWHLIKEDLYYTSKRGRKQVDTEIDGIKLTTSGKAYESTESKLKKRCLSIIADITTEKMSQSRKLRACWRYMTRHSRFRYALKYPNRRKKGWYRKTAENMLRTRSGNCYSFACAFAALAKELGYQPYVICGRVRGSRDHARDGYTRHAWVMINGRHYDPEAQWKPWYRGIYARRGYPPSSKSRRKVKFVYE